MSFGLLETSFSILKMSFGILEVSFQVFKMRFGVLRSTTKSLQGLYSLKGHLIDADISAGFPAFVKWQEKHKKYPCIKQQSVRRRADPF